MIKICFSKFLGVFGVVALLIGFIVTPALSQIVKSTGKTEEQSSQLVILYNNGSFFGVRESFIQVTNASEDTPINLHIQIFATEILDDSSNPAIDTCREIDFEDFYTPQDTHLYDMTEVVRNVGGDTGIDVSNTYGFIVITPVDGLGNAISHQHMFGTTITIVPDPAFGPLQFRLTSQGRDAVDFTTGAILTDGTQLDGNTNGYVVIQPDILKFSFPFEPSGENGPTSGVNLYSFAFEDTYGGPFGYAAVPADATWSPIIFDEDEQGVSCGTTPQNCTFKIGLNEQNELGICIGEGVLCAADLCEGNQFSDGWTRVSVGGLEGLENEFGALHFTTSGDTFSSGAGWMVTE